MTTNKPRVSGQPLSPYEHFVLGAEFLIRAKLPLPVPFRDALNGTPRPMALTTADDLPIWMRGQGYNAPQRAVLTRALGALAISAFYLRCIVEGTPRVTLNGEHVGTVTAAEAEFTAATLIGFPGKFALQYDDE